MDGMDFFHHHSGFFKGGKLQGTEVKREFVHGIESSINHGIAYFPTSLPLESYSLAVRPG